MAKKSTTEDQKIAASEEKKDVSYAVIQVGAHSHRVAEGDRVLVEWDNAPFNGEEVPSEISFDKVLLSKKAGTEAVVGTPTVEGAKVSAKVLGLKGGEKVVSYKKTRRQGYHNKKGHKQTFVEVEIAQLP
ncbi:MAG: 50S ribosomal protein L21 [Bdellovibrionales bacterium]|nr:50S ribosomal protein L21 [Bdellovibrionales bacterium]